MAIEVKLEKDDLPLGVERCCFCRKITPYWYKPADVACCQSCAKRADDRDVPDKKTWCRRERIAESRLGDPGT
jgi:hypothetical protein